MVYGDATNFKTKHSTKIKMAKTYLERGAELLEKMNLDELQEHFSNTRQAIVDKADTELKQAEAQANRLKAVKQEVTKGSDEAKN